MRKIKILIIFLLFSIFFTSCFAGLSSAKKDCAQAKDDFMTIDEDFDIDFVRIENTTINAGNETGCPT